MPGAETSRRKGTHVGSLDRKSWDELIVSLEQYEKTPP